MICVCCVCLCVCLVCCVCDAQSEPARERESERVSYSKGVRAFGVVVVGGRDWVCGETVSAFGLVVTVYAPGALSEGPARVGAGENDFS